MAKAPHVSLPMLFDEDAAAEERSTREDNIKMYRKYFICVENGFRLARDVD
jgi:hypothetical protein